MTMQIKARRFRIRRGRDGADQGDAPAAPAAATTNQRAAPPPHPAGPGAESVIDNDTPLEDHTPATPRADDPAPARTAAAQTGPDAESARPETIHSADIDGDAQVHRELEAIRGEALTPRQLRMAMRVATRHGVRATSGLDAVRLLRKRGIDPFERSTMLELIRPQEGDGTAVAVPQDTGDKLPAVRRPGATLPDTAASDRMRQIALEREAELRRIRKGISSRRRRRLVLLATRLLIFVSLPTFLVGYYFYILATPLYATDAEFVIQQADSSVSAGSDGLGGIFAGTGTAGNSQDSITVQSYLQSRGAMRRLNAEEGFREHFSGENIDILRRLAPDASEEAVYRLYQRQVRISFDPSEGIVRLEVAAATPEDSERFANALITYAEEQVDLMTARIRDSAMRDARQSFEQAETRMTEARQAAVDLQERFAVLSGDVEVSLISQQIVALESELTQARLSLQELLSNPRPNPARVDPLQRRVNALEAQIATLRGSMTQGTEGGASLARIQSELVMAEADVQTRQMLLTQALQQLETARIEAGRQVRYLSLSVTPIAPDEPTYPRAFENTALAFLIFSGIYLMLSMTAAILREQVSS
ncbi:MAG: capsule biosynthesis protein [Rhodobacteraceae bacterium]|nr:capsule biosynthesis protein [Paracoccaceae bacterium]